VRFYSVSSFSMLSLNGHMLRNFSPPSTMDSKIFHQDLSRFLGAPIDWRSITYQPLPRREDT
jgi:hypothetical protein